MRRLEVSENDNSSNHAFLSASTGERLGVTCRKSVGFHGPIMVEDVQVGVIGEETTANACANREFLQKMLALI